MTLEDKRFIENLKLEDFDLIQIKDVTISDIKQTYDIEVDEIHAFNARNIESNLQSVSHNSACITIFDYNDEDMMQAKTDFKVSKYQNFEKNEAGFWNGFVFVDGKKIEVTFSEWDYEKLKKEKLINWFYVTPWRARSNNSVLLLRNETSKEMFQNILSKTRQYGEPGFIFADDPLTLFNPCVTSDTKVKTNLGDLTILDVISKLESKEPIFALSLNEETKELQYKQILHGEKTKDLSDVIQIETEDGEVLKLTPDHLVFTENRGYIKASQLDENDTIIEVN